MSSDKKVTAGSLALEPYQLSEEEAVELDRMLAEGQARQKTFGPIPERKIPAYFRISYKPVHHTVELSPGCVFMDVDAEGKLIGLEVIGTQVEPQAIPRKPSGG